MQGAEDTVAWVLFWLFAAIATTATFLIASYHRPRRQALALTFAMLAFFVVLFIALHALLRALGL